MRFPWSRPGTVYVTLDCVEPQELMRHPVPASTFTRISVWLQLRPVTASGWPEVAIWGETSAVLEFVKDNWGEEEVDRVREELREEGQIPPFTRFMRRKR